AIVLIVTLASTIVGMLVGLTLGEAISGPIPVILAGLFGIIAAALVRSLVFVHLPKTGSGVSDVPAFILLLSLVASLAGSMTAQEITRELVHLRPSLVGGLAGLISAVLMVMLMTAYNMKPKS